MKKLFMKEVGIGMKRKVARGVDMSEEEPGMEVGMYTMNEEDMIEVNGAKRKSVVERNV